MHILETTLATSFSASLANPKVLGRAVALPMLSIDGPIYGIRYLLIRMCISCHRWEKPLRKFSGKDSAHNNGRQEDDES